MAERDPVIKYGVHSVAALNRTTGLPYGRARVIGEASFNLSGEMNKLFGGSSQFPWAANAGVLDGGIGLTLKEFPSWLTNLFMGVDPTVTLTPSTTGEVTAIANKLNATVVAATGIASVGLKAGETNSVRLANYIVVAVGATTVDVYAADDVDFNRETALLFEDNFLKITASPLTIVQSAAVEIPNTGLELTGGAGTIAMTIDDTATFESLPTYVEKTVVTVGPTALTFPEFKLIITGERDGETALSQLEIFRVKGVGLPQTYGEKAFNETEIAAVALNDSTLGVYQETYIR